MNDVELDAKQIEKKVSDLAEAMERVRDDEATRSDVVVDMKQASQARLELLAQDLQPVFQDVPEDNEQFENTVFTEKVEGDREASLLEMRRRMFSDRVFGGAVFIGGMGGIIDEFNLFKGYQPGASLVPVISTGGAALALVDHMRVVSEDLAEDLDYIALLHRHLNISTSEKRYASPVEQPAELEERLCRANEAKP